MNTLLLDPTDVLFFRDGRPMSGSLSGHGAAWPLPTVTNAALHAALHRAELERQPGVKLHRHDHHYRDRPEQSADTRVFGGLTTAGPFPVWVENPLSEKVDAVWYFPRPLDAGGKDSAAVSFAPVEGGREAALSSLPAPLKYPVANQREASKEIPAPWWSGRAWKAYVEPTSPTNPADFKIDRDFSVQEHTIGIGIDSATGAQDGERFYSAHYLRLHRSWRLGVLGEAQDKIDDNPAKRRDLLQALFPNSGARTPVIVGGQQRLCTVTRLGRDSLPLPTGKTTGFATHGDGEGKRWLVKWVLLSPAIFPEIADQDKNGRPTNSHSGGWLPNWIAQARHVHEGATVEAGSVLLLNGPGRDKALRKRLTAGKRIEANLVAAIVGKAIPVTGYALANNIDRAHGGAKSLHLAVPAGSVYYFEARTEAAATDLAAALNWHGAGNVTAIQNRRSTLFGEKGFGLGVCGTWAFHDPSAG